MHALGGYRVQGRRPAAADRLVDDARALEEAGACAHGARAAADRAGPAGDGRAAAFPTIGIGAGIGCDGQVLVLHDMLGLNEGFTPKFLKHYADLGASVRAAVRDYAGEVRPDATPVPEHSFE